MRDREHKQPGNMLYLVGEMENTQDNKDLGGAELFSTALSQDCMIVYQAHVCKGIKWRHLT